MNSPLRLRKLKDLRAIQWSDKANDLRSQITILQEQLQELFREAKAQVEAVPHAELRTVFMKASSDGGCFVSVALEGLTQDGIITDRKCVLVVNISGVYEYSDSWDPDPMFVASTMEEAIARKTESFRRLGVRFIPAEMVEGRVRITDWGDLA